MKNLQNSPSVYDLLFSGEVLYNDGKLTDNFIMTKECEFVLQKGNEAESQGGLDIIDDDYRTVWRNLETKRAKVGEYVLVMQKNGNAVIYGPEFGLLRVGWTTLLKCPLLRNRAMMYK
ncbi:hypothetical protein M5K25_024762 [Dendrobium thyrsiflorum]|uniref:Uncharacterized protein n=1 Tax=Dendrobium thyrsiflorum TaxID=117978 RepID=A0ABD0U2Z0_DENTH